MGPPPSYEDHSPRSNLQATNRPKLGEVKLFENPREGGRFGDLADLFAIFKTTEALESAYARDSVSSTEYTESCLKLIQQFKTSESALIKSGVITSADAFILEYKIADCPRAYERLIKIGTVHANNRGEILIVFQTGQEFITTMDLIKLGKCQRLLPAACDRSKYDYSLIFLDDEEPTRVKYLIITITLSISLTSRFKCISRVTHNCVALHRIITIHTSLIR